MAFKIAQVRRFTRTIPVMADGEEQSFKAVFNALSDDTLEAFDTRTRDGQQALLRAAVHRLDDVVDVDGAPMEDTRVVLEALLKQSDIRLTLLREYTAGLLGAKRGN